jgi:uncharacterized protein YegL
MPTQRFNTKTQRSMAVIVLADVSGSMAEKLGGSDTERKIDALNASIRDLFLGCAEPNPKAIISVAVITFGNGVAQSAVPLTVVKQAKWENAQPSGDTPLGKALTAAKRTVDEKNVIRTGSYRPVLVLATDGVPTDSWTGPLKELNDGLRSRQADRFALGIGLNSPEARQVLEEFVKPSATEGTPGKDVASRIFTAASAFDIHGFFEYVTLHSVRRATQNEASTDEDGDPDGY